MLLNALPQLPLPAPPCELIIPIQDRRTKSMFITTNCCFSLGRTFAVRLHVERQLPATEKNNRIQVAPMRITLHTANNTVKAEAGSGTTQMQS